MRHLTLIDRLLDGAQSALTTVAGKPLANRPSPAESHPYPDLSEHERKQTAGLMRINHTGEVCAQALYKGQALMARDQATVHHLERAASEETDHLVWCSERLDELESRPSLLNPLWYTGSYLIGAVAATMGDPVSLGFVVETERQVEKHLGEHLDRLPEADIRSQAILTQMREDEARHANNALARGGRPLPRAIPPLMSGTSKIMKTIAYRL